MLRANDVLADLPECAPGSNNADNAFLGPLLPRQALANSRELMRKELEKVSNGVKIPGVS